MSTRLSTRFDVFAWYRQVAAANRPVAWVSAFVPAEILLAQGIIPVYPENHAAMLGSIVAPGDDGQPYSRAAIARAEAHGYALPRLCSYALSDLGVLVGGAPSPLGALPAPDLVYTCDSQCRVVARWGDAVCDHFARQGRSVPHYVLHAPPLTRGERHRPDELAAFRAQILAHAADCGARFGTPLRDDALAETVAASATANVLWQRCLATARAVPTPWTDGDACSCMAPIVIARGDPSCQLFYRDLLAELEARRAAGTAAVPGERRRLLWDAIPVWPRRGWLARFLAQRQAALVTSTYTQSWWFELDPTRPLESIVERYAWNTMNRRPQWVLDWTLDLVRSYRLDGILAHRSRSCQIWNSYVQRRLDGYRAARVPVLVIEGDTVDPRAFDETATARALDAFVTGDCAEV